MDGYRRYAIYHAPPPGPLADFTARWLGWDPAAGRPRAHPEVAGLPRAVAELTAAPRRYGFHATLKPPFRLAPGTDAAALHRAVQALAGRQRAVRLDGLALARLGGFVALRPEGGAAALSALAAAAVLALEPFRAAPTPEEIARRRPERLDAQARDRLDRYGYPWVLDGFRFHMTLTGDLPEPEAAQVVSALAPLLRPLLPRPLTIDSLCLFGEDRAGMFHLLRRYTLSG